MIRLIASLEREFVAEPLIGPSGHVRSSLVHIPWRVPRPMRGSHPRHLRG